MGRRGVPGVPVSSPPQSGAPKVAFLGAAPLHCHSSVAPMFDVLPPQVGVASAASTMPTTRATRARAAAMGSGRTVAGPSLSPLVVRVAPAPRQRSISDCLR